MRKLPPRGYSMSEIAGESPSERGLDRLRPVGAVPLHHLADQVVGELAGAADLLLQLGVADGDL